MKLMYVKLQMMKQLRSPTFRINMNLNIRVVVVRFNQVVFVLGKLAYYFFSLFSMLTIQYCTIETLFDVDLNFTYCF